MNNKGVSNRFKKAVGGVELFKIIVFMYIIGFILLRHNTKLELIFLPILFSLIGQLLRFFDRTSKIGFIISQVSLLIFTISVAVYFEYNVIQTGNIPMIIGVGLFFVFMISKNIIFVIKRLSS